MACPRRISVCSALTASIEAPMTRKAIAASIGQAHCTANPSTSHASGASAAIVTMNWMNAALRRSTSGQKVRW